MKVIALATTHRREDLEPYEPDMILDNFLGFSLEQFLQALLIRKFNHRGHREHRVGKL